MKTILRSLSVVLVVGLLEIVAADSASLESLESLVGEDRRLGGPREELRSEIFAARKCHFVCGKDVACHAKCPNPWKILIEACHQAPIVMACLNQCAGDAVCIKTCPSFALDWIQKAFEKDAARAFSRSQRICPRLGKAHACHQACVPGDRACHHKCPRFHDHGGHEWHHDHEEMNREKPVDTATCKYCLASGKDFCISESKCIPKATFKCKGPHDHITGDRWFALHGNPQGIQHKMTCPGSETTVEEKVKLDAQGCYDKGKNGVWCPKGDGWYCVKNCKDEAKKELKPDANGCYDKGKYGVWCPKGDEWYCVKNCKEDAQKEVKPDAQGCYDKGKDGVWCPKGDDWFCVKNCEEGAKADSKECWFSALLSMFYNTFKSWVSDLPDWKQVSKEIVV